MKARLSCTADIELRAWHPVFDGSTVTVHISGDAYLPARPDHWDTPEVDDYDIEVVAIDGREYSACVMRSMRGHIIANSKTYGREIEEALLYGGERDAPC